MTDTADSRDLLALSMALFDQVKALFYGALAAGALSAIGAVAVIAINLEGHPLRQLGADVIIVALAIAGYVLFRLYKGKYDLALEARRLDQVERGIGWPVSAFVRTRLRHRAGPRARRTAEKYLADSAEYYMIERDQGPERLLDIVQESAFFTAAQFRMLRNLAGGLLIITLALVVLAVGFALASASQPAFRIEIARIVLALVPFAFSVGLVSWLLDLQQLANAIDRVDEDLENIRVQPAVKIEDVMRAQAEYQLLIARGLPVPGPIYRLMRDDLNRLWKERRP